MDTKESGDNLPSECQWLGKVFCNSIMLKKILVFLSLDDINTLRSVTPEINHEILSCKRFKNNAVFVICDKSVQTGALNRCEIKWKNVKIELYDGIGSNEEDKNRIQELLVSDVEFLNLTGNQDNPISFSDEYYNKEQKFPLFMDKIEKTVVFKSLTALHINSYILNGLKIRESPFLTDALFKNLKNLKLYFVSNLKLYNPVRETDNLVYISENCKSLVEFTVDRIVESHIDGSLAAKKAILEILSSNAPTLTSLYVDDESVWNLKEISEMNFPVLKHCGIRCTVASENHALTFLTNLNENLESLSVVFKKYLPIKILKAICDKSKGLKKLHVKAPQLGDTHEDVETSDLWTFLQNMENLQDFSLIEPFNSQYARGLLKFPQLLRNLPRNLEKIKIRGMENLELGFTFAMAMPHLSFENLTVLNLLRTRDAIHDSDMQYICSKMTNLVQFMFSHLEYLTDSGITGITIDEKTGERHDSSISIKCLKGLKILTIRDCRQLTTTICGSIAFKFLTDLNLGNNPSLNITSADADKFATTVLTQNPLLKNMSLSYCSGLDTDLLSKKFTDISGGKCSLHLVENDWPTYDSDIDAEDELVFDNDHDSDFSGGGYNHHDDDDFGFSEDDDDDDDDGQYDY